MQIRASSGSLEGAWQPIVGVRSQMDPAFSKQAFESVRRRCSPIEGFIRASHVCSRHFITGRPEVPQ